MLMLQTVKYQLEGVSPLLMHNGSLGDPLNFWAKKIKEITAKQKKTDADHEEIGRLEWRGGLYLHDGMPCVPDVAQKATLFNASKSLKMGRKVKAGLFVYDHAMLTYHGPADLDALWDDEQFRDRRPMRVGTSMVMRTRPKFDRWSMDMVIGFDDEVLNAGQVDQFVRIGGRLIGLLEGRPAYGRYNATKL
jgi:hypothetical protein